MPRSKTRELRWQRVQQVMELSAIGLGPYEICKRLEVSAHTIYEDMNLYRRMYEFFQRTEQRLPHLMNKSNRALRQAWEELTALKALTGEQAAAPKDIALFLSRILDAIGLQARILGVDQSPQQVGGGKVAETLIIQVQTGERRETIALTTKPEPERVLELPEVLTDVMGMGDGHQIPQPSREETTQEPPG